MKKRLVIKDKQGNKLCTFDATKVEIELEVKGKGHRQRVFIWNCLSDFLEDNEKEGLTNDNTD